MKRQVVQLAADQAISSLTTFTLSVHAARESSMREFGVFAVGYALLWVLLGVNRAFVGELNLILGRDKLDATEYWRSYSSTTAIVAGVVSAIVLLISCILVASTDLMWIPWSFALATPLAILADTIRFVAFTDELNGDALMIDTTWLLGALFAPMAISAAGAHPVPSAILGWGLGAGLGVGVALKRRPLLRPRLRGAREWAADRRVMGIQFAADFLANNGIGQAATALVPVVSSLAVAGALRAGSIIMGPLNVVYSATTVFLIPRIRGSISSDRVLPSPAPTVMAALAVLYGLYTVGILLLPDRLGEALLGLNWHSGQSVAPLLIAAFMLQALAQVMVQVMRLRGAAGLVVRVRMFVSVLLFAGVLTGAAFLGARGAAGAFALAALASIVPWWFAVVHSRRISGGNGPDECQGCSE